MIPTYSGMQTALSGLQAYQAAIDTIGQNIANVNTPGYSRQRVDLTERNALAIPAMSNVTGTGGQLGMGVDISSISRIRNQFLDTQYRAQSATSGATTQASTDVASAQSALNEPSSSGISAQLQSFWSAWTGVANHPTGSAAPAALQTLLGSATTLAQSFKSVDAQLATVQTDAANQLSTLTGATGQLQTEANQIAALNGAIAQSTAAGQTPNNLLDQRDQLLDGMSGLANLSVTTRSNGMVDVNLTLVGSAGTTTPYPLVSGTTATSLPQPPPPLNFQGGQLGALYNDASPTGPIGTLRSSLDTVANQLVTTVNALQPTSPFFSGNSASTIAVVATASTVQTSSSSTSGADLATKIAALQGGTADQSYSAFVGQVGNAVKSAQSTSTTASSLLSSIDSQRQSVSGVSLSEEMTNLISYQQGYQASAKVMNTIDAMFNTLINNTGL